MVSAGLASRGGTKLAFNVLYASDPVIFGEQLTAWASEAKKVGIDITLQGGTFNRVTTVANDPGSPKTINQWAAAVAGGFYILNYHLGHLQHRRVLQRRVLPQPPGEPTDQRLGHQRQPQRGQGRGAVSHRAAAQPVPAQPRLRRRVEEQCLRPPAMEGMTQYGLNAELMYLTN
jgi:hypothetical protein